MENKLVANIGGIFIHCENPEKVAKWYKNNLGIQYEFAEEYGTRFCMFFYLEEDTKRKAYLVFSYMRSDHPIPKNRSFTLNLRVNNLGEVIVRLKENGIDVKGPKVFPEGKFAWLTDPEGTPIELWEDTTLK
ncbi:VOC family protein [Sunxiuqinia sp. A32]|uniref:VOC family protein n=1 Tax=Sunxiuqinia sp. A32 TaxID=3461496 RepID=UPI00404565A6